MSHAHCVHLDTVLRHSSYPLRHASYPLRHASYPLRHAGESLMATMPHSHPWRYRDVAELHGAASSFEYEAAEDAALQLQARVTPEWWAGACALPEPMELSCAVRRTEHASAKGEGRNDSPSSSSGRGGGGGGSSGSSGGGGGGNSSAAADAASKEEKVPTSQYRGVSRRYGRWKARIKQNGTDIVIGDFDNEVTAAPAPPCVRGCSPHRMMPD